MFTMVKKKILLGLFAFAVLTFFEKIICSENDKLVTFLTEEQIITEPKLLVIDSFTCNDAVKFVVSHFFRESFFHEVEYPLGTIEFVFAIRNNSGGELVERVVRNADMNGWNKVTIKELIDRAVKMRNEIEGKPLYSVDSVICFVRFILHPDFTPSIDALMQLEQGTDVSQEDELVDFEENISLNDASSSSVERFQSLSISDVQDDETVSLSPEEIERISQSVFQDIAADEASREAEERILNSLIEETFGEEKALQAQQKEEKRKKQEAEEARNICCICLDDIENIGQECFPAKLIRRDPWNRSVMRNWNGDIIFDNGRIYDCDHSMNLMHRVCLRDKGWKYKDVRERCPACRAEGLFQNHLPNEDDVKLSIDALERINQP